MTKQESKYVKEPTSDSQGEKCGRSPVCFGTAVLFHVCSLFLWNESQWLVKYEFPIRSRRHQNTKDFGPACLDLVDAGHQHVLKGTPANVDLVPAAVVIVVFEAQLTSLYTLNSSWRLNKGNILLKTLFHVGKTGYLTTFFWFLLQN